MASKRTRWLAAAGSGLLIGVLLVGVLLPLGTESSVSTRADGTTVAVERHVSLWASQPQPVHAIVAIVAGFAVVAGLLVVFGGRIGGLLVVVVSGLAGLASMLSIGIFLAPGLGLLATAAIVAEADRVEDRRRRRLPPPPIRTA